MKRYLIFCGLFLSGLIAPVSVSAQPSCKADAYVNDSDLTGLNVRSGPGTQYAILHQLQSDHGIPPMLQIISAHGFWLQINQVHNIANHLIFKGPGWVYAPLLATSTRSTSGMYAALRTAPNKKSQVMYQIPAFSQVTLLSCQGKWLKVRYQQKKGWLSPQEQCPNPVTTCP